MKTLATIMNSKKQMSNIDTLRVIDAIECSKDIKLSVQGSFTHYSTPRKSLSDFNLYEDVEVCIMRGSYCVPPSDKMLADFSRLEELKEHWGYDIYTYVPVDLVEDLMWFLVKIGKTYKNPTVWEDLTGVENIDSTIKQTQDLMRTMNKNERQAYVQHIFCSEF